MTSIRWIGVLAQGCWGTRHRLCLKRVQRPQPELPLSIHHRSNRDKAPVGGNGEAVHRAVFGRGEPVEKGIHISMELDSTEMIKRFVMAELGVGFVAGGHCREELATGRLAARSLGPEPMVRQIGW